MLNYDTEYKQIPMHLDKLSNKARQFLNSDQSELSYLYQPNLYII